MRICRIGGPLLYTIWLNGGGHPQLHSYCKLPEGLHRKTICPTIKQLTECTISFPRVILLCLYREVQPKNPEDLIPQAPNPIKWNPNNPILHSDPKPNEIIYLAWLFCSHPIKLQPCTQHNQSLWWHWCYIIGYILSSVERQHLHSARFSIHSLLGFRGGWIQISGLKSFLALKPKLRLFETENLTKIYV